MSEMATAQSPSPPGGQASRMAIWLRVARGVAWVAGIFAVLACTLLVASYVQTHRLDPLNAKALQELSARLAAHPEDAALRDQVRDLDQLARRAFFSNQVFMNLGGRILLVAVCIFLVAAGFASAAGQPAPDPRHVVPPADPAQARRFVGVFALLLALGAVLLAFGSRSLLGNLGLAERAGRPEAAPFARAPTGVHGAEVDRPSEPEAPEPQPTGGVHPAMPSPAALHPTAGAADTPSDAELATNWPCFRGFGGNGIAGTAAAPTNWDGNTGTGIVWKIAMPRAGFSSPVVWRDRVYLSGADATTRELFCFRAGTGELLWRREAAGIAGSPATPPKVSDDTGYAAPTPATDGRRVFALFATGDLLCVDPDGRPLWSRNLGVPENRYGHASSLMIWRDVLLAQYDQGNGAKLLALDTRTGKTRWEQPRDVNPSWASPVVVNTGSRVEAILTADPWVISYDPQSGTEWWRVKCMGGEVGCSPAYVAGMVFVANAYVRLAAIDIERQAVAWESAVDLPDVASPLATHRHLFLGTSSGIVTCYDSRLGTQLWQQEFDNGFYASPVLVGDTVYWMDQSGVMHIFRAAAAYEELGRPALGEKSVCTPAFVGRRIYIRGEKNLFCIGDAHESS